MISLLCLYILLTPLSTMPELMVHLGPVSLTPGHIMTMLLFYLTFCRATTNWLNVTHHKAIRVLLYILVLWTAESMVSLLWLDRNVYGYDHKRPLNFLEYIIIILVFLVNVREKKDMQKIMYACLLGASLVTIFTFAKAVGAPIPGWERNITHVLLGMKFGVTAFFKSSESYAAFTLPLIPAILISFRTRYPINLNKPAMSVLFIISILLISLNGSRSTMVAITSTIFISLCFAMFTNIYNKAVSKYIAYILMSTLLGVLLIFHDNIISFMVAIREATVEERFRGYSLGWSLLTEDVYGLLFGAGKETFVLSLVELTGAATVPHNLLMEELVSDGIIGAGLMVFFFVKVVILALKDVNTLRKMKASEEIVMATFFVASLLSIITEGFFTNITSVYSVWFMVGMILCLSNNLHFGQGIVPMRRDTNELVEG